MNIRADSTQNPQNWSVKKNVGQLIDLASYLCRLPWLFDLYAWYPWCFGAVWRESSCGYAWLDLVCAWLWTRFVSSFSYFVLPLKTKKI